MRFKKVSKNLIRVGIGVLSVSAMVLSGIAFPGSAGNRVYADTYYADYMSQESLKEVYADRFRLGVAVQAISHWGDQSAEIGNVTKEQFIDNQFNSMTFGNEFKPAYNFSASSDGLFKVDRAAEELLDWATEHNMPVRGHVLVWHSQVDPSIFAKDFKATSGGTITKDYNAVLDEDCLVDRATLLKRLDTYINSVIEYTYANGYADTIYAWDVVNEAVEEGQDDGLRRSYWYRIIGPDFLYYSFLYAREAETRCARQYAADYGLDPDGDLSSITPELFYNDYNEWYTVKCNKIITLLTETPFNEGHNMVKSDVINPDGDGTIYGDGLIDGIGLQGHMTDTESLAQYKTAIEKYAAAINNLHVTELDVGKSVTGPAGDFRQAKFYYDFFKLLCDEQDAGVNITSVTLWGLTDTSSWRKDTEPLLFNRDLSGKPAFEAVLMAGKGEEFTLKDTAAIGKAEDILITFEPVTVDGQISNKTPTEYGFIGRGAGHQATIMLKLGVNHTEGATPGFSLQVRREAQDATVRYDITRFIGHTVKIGFYYKSADAKLYLGTEGYESGPLEYEITGEDWQLIEAVLKVPEDADTVALYFETDGNGEFLIDDFCITLADDMEAADGLTDPNAEPAPEDTETGAETETPAATPEAGTGGGGSKTFGIIALIAALVIAALGLKVASDKKVSAKEDAPEKKDQKSGDKQDKQDKKN